MTVSVIKGRSGGSVVRALRRKRPGCGFEFSSYACVCGISLP